MDFTKLLSLLDKSELFFPSALILAEDDPYEGSYARGNLDYDPSKDPSFKDKNLKVLKNFQKVRENSRIFTRDFARRGVYINSWYMSENESAAMWKCYTENKDGVAIQTTVGRLKAAIKDNLKETYIGKIIYINYEVSAIPENNLFWNFVHKRKSFEHEKELRAMFINNELFNQSAELEKGVPIPIDIDELIEKIFISPTAPDWTKKLLESVLEKYKRNFVVKKSNLHSEGLW